MWTLLSCNPEYEVEGLGEEDPEALGAADPRKPVLILLDLSRPGTDGLDMILKIKRIRPTAKILVLTVHKSDEHIRNVLSAGVDGYLLLEDTYSELMLAMENVFSGRPYISAGISGKVIRGYIEGKADGRPPDSSNRLTQREREILKMVAEGYRNKEIGDFLCISSKTVEKHRANLMKKLDLHSVPSLTTFAIEKGIAIA